MSEITAYLPFILKFVIISKLCYLPLTSKDDNKQGDEYNLMHKTVSAKQNMCNGNDTSAKKGEFGSQKVTHDMCVNMNVCDKKLIAHLEKSNCKYD